MRLVIILYSFFYDYINYILLTTFKPKYYVGFTNYINLYYM